MSEYVPFNINDNVKVKLTDHGRQAHRKRHYDFWESVGSMHAMEYDPPTEDEEGWSTWQMWQLMQTFGEEIGIPDRTALT